MPGALPRVLSGLAFSGRRFRVRSYDPFRSCRTFWAGFMPDEPLPEADDSDLLPVVRSHFAP